MNGELIITGEGHGEVAALQALVMRTLKFQGHQGIFAKCGLPRRFDISKPGLLEEACEYARAQETSALLITNDWEDGCPKKDAPPLAARVRALNLPFPTAVVLFYREYESLALSIAPKLAGGALVEASGRRLVMNSNPPSVAAEGKRGAKEWLRRNMLEGKAYKPTTHQLPLTRIMQPADLRAANLSSFRRFERALHFLVSNQGSGGVYP